MRQNDFNFRFDIEKLLSPISPESPAGADLRYDPIYDRIRELRRDDESDLPVGVWQSDPKRADWRAAEELCLEVLETRSKDLQIAAWLLQIWIHLYGFAGAAQGLVVIRALCESFWEDLHPALAGTDSEYRIAPFVWMNQKITVDLKLTPLTAPESDNVAHYNWSDWENACLLDKRPQPNATRAVTIAKFQQSVMLTPTLHLSAALDAIRAIFLASEAIDLLLDSKLKREAPGLSPIKNLAGTIAALLSSALEQRGISRGATQMQEKCTDLGAGYTMTGVEEETEALAFSKIRSRSQAYQMLAEAAEYLAQTEPHSPVPFLVRRAISWGTMTLDTLMAELVRNPNDLSEIGRLLSFGDFPKSKN